MRYALLLNVFFMLTGVPVAAQDGQVPEVRTSLENDTAVPGQPLLYRVTVLVPTWLPSPPEFPSYEAPNVVVRLPSRASGPASETIGGETWSGVTRSYRLYPMIAGTYQIPAGRIKITYSDPDTQEPVVTEVTTDSFEITGQIPPGSEKLDPFLAANSVTMERSVEGNPQEMGVGDALTLTTVVNVAGVAPMFVPPFGQNIETGGLAVYPKEPVLEEREDRGLLSGTRTEETVLVAEADGSYTVPEATLSWFNLKSGKIESIAAPAISINVTGTAVPEPQPKSAAIDWRRLFGSAMFVVLIGFAAFFVWRRYASLLTAYARELKNRHRATEGYLFKMLVAAIRSRDLSLLMRRSLDWQRTVERKVPNCDWSAYNLAFHQCCALSFSRQVPKSSGESRKSWDHLLTAARSTRDGVLNSRRNTEVQNLPDLNPR